ARPRNAVVVHDVDVDEVRLRGCAGVPGGTAGCDPRHEGAVAATVAGRVLRERAELAVREHAVPEVGPVLDPGSHDRVRGRVRARSRGVDARPVLANAAL